MEDLLEAQEFWSCMYYVDQVSTTFGINIGDLLRSGGPPSYLRR